MEGVVNSFLAFIFHHYLASQHDQQFLSKLVMRKLSSNWKRVPAESVSQQNKSSHNNELQLQLYNVV